MMKCEKYNYPYPDECLNAVLFLDDKRNFYYDVLISQSADLIKEHISNKTLLRKYKYLGCLNKIKNIKNESLISDLPTEYKRHIYNEMDKVRLGKKTEKEPLYIYLESEVNEALVA